MYYSPCPLSISIVIFASKIFLQVSYYLRWPSFAKCHDMCRYGDDQDLVPYIYKNCIGDLAGSLWCKSLMSMWIWNKNNQWYLAIISSQINKCTIFLNPSRQHNGTLSRYMYMAIPVYWSLVPELVRRRVTYSTMPILWSYIYIFVCILPRTLWNGISQYLVCQKVAYPIDRYWLT